MAEVYEGRRRVIVGGRGDPVRAQCQICSQPRALTASGKFYPLTAAGPRVDYVLYICENCVSLFNTHQWPKTKTVLRKLRDVWGDRRNRR